MNSSRPNSDSRIRLRSLIAIVYGVCLILSGLWRFLSAEGGHTGLIFGIVVGGIALVAGALYCSRRFVPRIVPNILIVVSLFLAGGWFCYEALIKKGITNAEPRQLIVIGISIVTAIVLVLVSRSKDHGPGETSG